MRKLLGLAILVLFAALPAYGQSYSTTFNYTENPISNGGNWINGGAGAAGIDWSNVQTNGSMAFGALTNAGATYNDATAVLTGTWSATQSAQATVSIPSPVGSGGSEVELRIRTTITAHSITGYEIVCSLNSGSPYMSIVRWNGPITNFTILTPDANVFCQNGDVIKWKQLLQLRQIIDAQM